MIDWRWLAGFTDGDGCISVHRNFDLYPSQVSIQWAQADAQIELLWAVKDFLDEHGVRNSWSENKSPKASGEVWVLAVHGAPCKIVLKKMLPYLVSEKKAARARRVLEAWKTRTPKVNTVHP